MSNQYKYQQIIDMTSNAIKQLKADNGDPQHILLLQELNHNTCRMKELALKRDRKSRLLLIELNRVNIPLFMKLAEFEGVQINDKHIKILGR